MKVLLHGWDQVLCGIENNYYANLSRSIRRETCKANVDLEISLQYHLLYSIEVGIGDIFRFLRSWMCLGIHEWTW